MSRSKVGRSTIRYGILGTGGYARSVNRLFGEIGGTVLVAACDSDAECVAVMVGPVGAAVKSLRIGVAVAESLESGRPVAVPRAGR